MYNPSCVITYQFPSTCFIRIPIAAFNLSVSPHFILELITLTGTCPQCSPQPLENNYMADLSWFWKKPQAKNELIKHLAGYISNGTNAIFLLTRKMFYLKRWFSKREKKETT